MRYVINTCVCVFVCVYVFVCVCITALQECPSFHAAIVSLQRVVVLTLMVIMQLLLPRLSLQKYLNEHVIKSTLYHKNAHHLIPLSHTHSDHFRNN
jgi:formate hydrogenlyase subunit 4